MNSLFIGGIALLAVAFLIYLYAILRLAGTWKKQDEEIEQAENEIVSASRKVH